MDRSENVTFLWMEITDRVMRQHAEDGADRELAQALSEIEAVGKMVQGPFALIAQSVVRRASFNLGVLRDRAFRAGFDFAAMLATRMVREYINEQPRKGVQAKGNEIADIAIPPPPSSYAIWQKNLPTQKQMRHVYGVLRKTQLLEEVIVTTMPSPLDEVIETLHDLFPLDIQQSIQRQRGLRQRFQIVEFLEKPHAPPPDRP